MGDIPFYQTFIFVILFAWLKMAQVCNSPFDGDSVYDVNVENELDQSIWAASAALEPLGQD
jgi:hypothetical protein